MRSIEYIVPIYVDLIYSRSSSDPSESFFEQIPYVVIIDARTPQEQFAARIPNWILDNWEEGLGQGGRMIKNEAELEAHFRKKELQRQGSYVLLSCGNKISTA